MQKIGSSGSYSSSWEALCPTVHGRNPAPVHTVKRCEGSWIPKMHRYRTRWVLAADEPYALDSGFISFFALQRVESHEAERKCQVLMKVPHRKGRKFRSFQTRWCSTRAPCAKKMRKCIIEVCIKYVYPGTHESIAGTGSVQIKLNETHIWWWLLVAISTELVPF